MRLIDRPESPRSTRFPFGLPCLLASVERILQGILVMKSFARVSLVRTFFAHVRMAC
jgi:hypothetical protein